MLAKVKHQEHQCQFCLKGFSREGSLIAHQCAKKMRFLDKDNKNSLIAFQAYQRFYQLTTPKYKYKIDFMHFINSTFYGGFYKFACWLNDTNIVKPEAYIDYVIKNNIKLSDWPKQSIYDQFLKSFIFKEHPQNALDRSILEAQEYCQKLNIELKDFFEKVNTNTFVDTLRSGKISPWLLFISEKSQILLDRLDESQYNLMGTLLDKKVWYYKIIKYQKDIKELQNIIKDIGL